MDMDRHDSLEPLASCSCDLDAASMREDVLISRAIDGQAGPEEWTELADLARTDRAVWARVSAALADHAALTDYVNHRVAAANSLALPVGHGPGPSCEGFHAGRAASKRWVGLARWSGWAAAAVVALAWVGLHRVQSPTRGPLTAAETTRDDDPQDPPGPALAVTPVSLTTDQARQNYLDTGLAEGRIVREMEPVWLGSNVGADGRPAEVFYLRQFIERVEVEGVDVYEVGTDDTGMPRAMPVGDVVAEALEIH